MAGIISDAEKAFYTAELDAAMDTFLRDIVVVTSTKTPVDSLSENDDDYDFVNDVNHGSEEFSYSYQETTISARIKYLDKQEIIQALPGQEIDISTSFGVIRIKVAVANCDLVANSNHILVDGNHCKILFRDRPHGLFDITYCTFYLERQK